MKSKTKSALLSILLPERCPYCGAVIKPGEAACVYCREEFPQKNPEKIIFDAPPVICAVPYEGKYRNAILGIKSGKGLQFAHQMAELICDKLKVNLPELDFEVVTYVPMHKADFMEKGFNHSEVLANHVSEILGLPCEELLKKTKKNTPQHKLPANKRAKNVEGVYKAVKKSLIKGRKVLIIDDIITTGYTLAECAKILKQSKAESIYFATFAVSVPKTT